MNTSESGEKPYNLQEFSDAIDQRVKEAISTHKEFSNEGLPIVEHGDLAQTFEVLMKKYVEENNVKGFLHLFRAYGPLLVDDPAMLWSGDELKYTLEFAGKLNSEAFRLRKEGRSSEADNLMKLCKKLGFFVNKNLTSIYDVEAKASYERGWNYDRE